MRVNRFDRVQIARSDGRTSLGDGSIRIKAKLTRVGVFPYQTDGGMRSEAKLPDELFSKASLDSLKGVTVSIGHEAWVEPSTWRQVAVGHVADDVHRDDDYVVGSLVIKDARAIRAIDAQELTEVSLGFSCREDAMPGTFGGVAYDMAQRDIAYNHCAIGPKEWARVRGAALLDAAASSEVSYSDTHHAAMKLAMAEQAMLARYASAEDNAAEKARRELHERHANAWKANRG